METEVIRSYLVGMGFTVDQPQFKKFEHALTTTGDMVKRTTGGIALDFLKWQTGIVGIFTTVTGTIVGMAEKAAMADQKYRLMGERMFMTTEQARKTSMALDTLGASLEEVAWDPELHARFLQLINDQERLGKMLGPDYAKQMKQMRDIRFEMSRVEVVGEYIGMKFLQDVFKGLGLGDGSVLEQLQKGVDYLMVHGPELAQVLADTAVPVMKDTWEMAKQIGQMLIFAGSEFTNLVGIISGDDSLTKEKVSFEDFAHAIERAVHWLAELVHLMFIAEKGAGAVLDFTVTGIKSLDPRLNQAQIDKLVGRQTGDIGKLGGAVSEFGQTLMGHNAYDGKRGTAFGTPADGAAGGGGGGMLDDVRREAARVGKMTGLDPALIFGQWMHETNGLANRGARELNNFSGIRIPGTKTYEKYGDLDKYGDAYSKLVTGKRYGAGLKAAHTPEQFAAALKHGADGLSWYEGPAGSADGGQRDYANGMRRFMGQYSAASKPSLGSGGGGPVQVNVENITIGGTSASPREIATAVGDGVRDKLGKQTQRDLAQLQGVYSY